MSHEGSAKFAQRGEDTSVAVVVHAAYLGGEAAWTGCARVPEKLHECGTAKPEMKEPVLGPKAGGGRESLQSR